MEIRNFFKNVFKKGVSNANSGGYQALQMLNSFTPYLIADNNNVYDNLTIRACIDAIAKHTAKLTPKIIGFKNKYSKRLDYLLTNSPNKIDSRYDFIYKVTAQLLTNNNAFVFIHYDTDGLVEGLYPVPYSSIEFLEKDNEIYCRFLFKNGSLKVILPYSELIHLKRHYNESDLFGSSQSYVLNPVLKLFKSFTEGFINAVNSTSMLRGYLKYAGNLKAEDLNNYKKSFVSSYMDGSDGIGALDSKCDFISTEIKPYTIDSKNQDIANTQIYNYYGISEEILKGKYKEEDFNAFYNSTIEPLAIQFSEEFTRKLFTAKEIEQLGKKIIMSASRLTFANNSTKMTICKEFLQLGVFSFNEVREIFELEPVEGGDKRIVSLNYVDVDKANEYQGVEDKENLGDKKNETKEETD